MTFPFTIADDSKTQKPDFTDNQASFTRFKMIVINKKR